MRASPPRTEFGRVSSRIKGKYTSGESAGNVEAVLHLSSSYDDDMDRRPHNNGDEGEEKVHPSPYGLRRIFSNPPAVRRTSIETSLLHSEEELGQQENKNKTAYGLRRIFSNPHSNDVDTGIPLTKTKSYHYPLSRNNDKGSPSGSPVTLVRRVSRLKHPEKCQDDDTVAESVEVSLSSSTKSVKRGNSKKRWAVLFAFLGVVGAGAYAGYTFLGGEKKKKKKSSKRQQIYTQSLQSFGGSNAAVFEFVPEHSDDNVMTPDSSNQDAALLILSDVLLPTSTPSTYMPTDVPVTESPVTPITPERTTLDPSKRPTKPPSNPPSPRPTEDTTIVFYVMADAPYSDYERDEVMPDVMETLPSDAELLFHLGDLEFKKEDNCEEWAYQAASRALRKSPVPTFVLPGDNDLNDCDDHEEAEGFWSEYFGYIDEYWNHTIPLTRWGTLDESFAFIQKRILFFGINIVGGTPYSTSEKTERHEEHLYMLKSIMDDHRWDYDIVVLLGHAEPKDKHADLFEGDDGLASFVEQMRKPFLHIHGDYHCWYEDEGSFGVDNYLRISLDSLIREDEEVAVPIRVEIDSSKRYGAVKIDRGRTGWDVECCSGNGWPRPSDDDDYDDDYSYDSEDRRELFSPFPNVAT